VVGFYYSSVSTGIINHMVEELKDEITAVVEKIVEKHWLE
jgi:septum formation topological specificity factor MinE